ncbi:ABC transporter ATP-binding protein [Paenirhodobacter sp.]|uniref:ABC transporter ATP-binding protein n=1 Tax=Paenirhodobacter sp. TaxID=1965326 RepID=UPI003B4079FF
MLNCHDLSVTWPGGQPALRGVTLDLKAGERLALIGESGSGKSTLARAIAGLLPAGSRVTGRIGWDRPARPGRDIGYVFQDPGGSLDPLLTIGAHLRETLRATRSPARPEDLLRQVALPGVMKRYPHQLSGGQKQRVAIALAIAAGPRLLIADEATSALDVLVQAEITALLRKVTEGRALLFITHDIALAAGLADRIAVMYRGRLVETGPARQVVDAPRDAYTRALLAATVGLDTPRLVR